MMKNENVLKLEIKLDRIFYPKYVKKITDGEFGIFSAMVIQCLDDTVYNQSYIKLKGVCPNVEYGRTYKIYCSLCETNEQYGDTYEILFMCSCADMSTKDKQKEFLRHVLPQKIVDGLFEMYNDVIPLLENKDMDALTKVKGIGVNTGLRILNLYEESKDYSSLYVELGQLGLTVNFVKRLVDFYHSPDRVVEIIRKNPYQLVEVDGIGFKKADDVACKTGIEKYDIRRVVGFIKYYLNEQGESGKSYLHYTELMKAIFDNLEFVPDNTIKAAANLLVSSNEIMLFDNNEKIALHKFYNLELNILIELYRLQAGEIQIIDSDTIIDSKSLNVCSEKNCELSEVEEKIKDIELKQGFDFTEEQRQAILMGTTNNVVLITGGAGVGKSATANGILKLYPNATVLACALSGKAAVRITEITGFPASTIHKALGYMDGKFTYTKEEPLDVDVVLIDEATMINGTLFLSLLEAIPTGAKVIIMGDIQQLTPIGNCQVFNDVLNSDKLPIVKLTKPHRQALRSGIVPTSIKIANQEQLFDSKFKGNIVLGELQDMELDIEIDSKNLDDKVINHFKTEMDKYHNILEVQICVPMKLRGAVSCYNLNKRLQDMYNPKFSTENEIRVKLTSQKEDKREYIIREGDKVINTKNNYKTVNELGSITPIFNGNIGIVKQIFDNGSCCVDFAEIGDVFLKRKDVDNLELAYACTIHKCQGSQFLSTIVAIDNSSYIMNNSELLYTAITRARKYCVLIGNNSAIRKAIQTKEMKTKQTFLKDMLMNEKGALHKNGYII